MTNTLKSSLVHIGDWLSGKISNEGSNDDALLRTAEAENRWFTPHFSKTAMLACGNMLQEEKLDEWMSRYAAINQKRSPKRVGLVLAGNLPMVGWHDVLCVLISGHHAVIKYSTNDRVLISTTLNEWVKHHPQMAAQIEVTQGKVEGVDAVIATGSSNTKRYFDYYFRRIPRILRSQRTSIAVLSGNEPPDELRALGHDVFTYYGMGCRSVTQLFVPANFDLNRLFSVWTEWAYLSENNKYANNYDYHKAIWLLNQEVLVENGFLLMKEDTGFFSPVGTLYYAFYDEPDAVRDLLLSHSDQIQCIVTGNSTDWSEGRIPQVAFGQSQNPNPWDFADGVDTMSFLLELSSPE